MTLKLKQEIIKKKKDQVVVILRFGYSHVSNYRM